MYGIRKALHDMRRNSHGRIVDSYFYGLGMYFAYPAIIAVLVYMAFSETQRLDIYIVDGWLMASVRDDLLVLSGAVIGFAIAVLDLFGRVRRRIKDRTMQQNVLIALSAFLFYGSLGTATLAEVILKYSWMTTNHLLDSIIGGSVVGMIAFGCITLTALFTERAQWREEMRGSSSDTRQDI